MNRITQLTAAVATVALFAAGSAMAGPTFSITPQTNSPSDNWEAETGQSMPTGVVGFINGTLVLSQAAPVTFTFGTVGLNLPGPQSGHGDSVFENLVYFTAGSVTTQAQALAAGWVFCTPSGDVALCGGKPMNAGSTSFTISEPAGAIQFHYVFGSSSQNTLNDGSTFFAGDNSGAYITTLSPISTISANAGPGQIAYVGLSDQSYPADHDFQDLTFQAQIPEPATLSVFGLGLLGLLKARRRRQIRT